MKNRMICNEIHKINDEVIISNSVDLLDKYILSLNHNLRINQTLVFLSNLWIIVGPNLNSEKACFHCMIERFKINKEYMNKFSGDDSVEIYEDEESILLTLISFKNPDTGLIINRSNMNIHEFNISRLDYCKRCNTSILPHSKLNKQIDEKSFRVNRNFNELKISDYIDWYAGIIKYKYININSNLYPMVGAMLYFDKMSKDYVGGFGRNRSFKKSNNLAYLEALERYYTSSDKKNYDKIITSSYEELVRNKKNVLSPELFIYKSDDVTTEFNDKIEYKWIPIKNLMNDQEYYVINQFVSYFNADTQPNLFFENTSNGCALGTLKNEAILYGLLESIERDAFLIAWEGRIVSSRIDISSIRSETTLDMINSLNLHGYEVLLFDITTEFNIPVVWTFLKSITDEYKVFYTFSAAGSHLYVEKAIEASLLEAMSSLGVYESMLNNESDINYINDLNHKKRKVVEMEDHLKLYASKDQFIKFEFLDNVASSTVEELNKKYSFDSNMDIIKILKNKIGDQITNIYYYEFESTILNELDLSAVRVIFPGLLPMTFGEDKLCTSKMRLKSHFEYLGKEWDEKINVEPHPFP